MNRGHAFCVVYRVGGSSVTYPTIALIGKAAGLYVNIDELSGINNDDLPVWQFSPSLGIVIHLAIVEIIRLGRSKAFINAADVMIVQGSFRQRVIHSRREIMLFAQRVASPTQAQPSYEAS